MRVLASILTKLALWLLMALSLLSATATAGVVAEEVPAGYSAPNEPIFTDFNHNGQARRMGLLHRAEFRGWLSQHYSRQEVRQIMHRPDLMNALSDSLDNQYQKQRGALADSGGQPGRWANFIQMLIDSAPKIIAIIEEIAKIFITHPVAGVNPASHINAMVAQSFGTGVEDKTRTTTVEASPPIILDYGKPSHQPQPCRPAPKSCYHRPGPLRCLLLCIFPRR